MVGNKAQWVNPFGIALDTVSDWLAQVMPRGCAEDRPTVATRAIPELLAIDHDDLGEVLLLGPFAGALRPAAAWLAGNDVQVVWEAGYDHAFTGTITRPAISHLLVDVDSAGGITELLEPLLALREARPDLVVILVSHDFLLNDFGPERLPLCDASLRAPLSFSALELALTEAAQHNNRLWVDRKAARALERA